MEVGGAGRPLSQSATHRTASPRDSSQQAKVLTLKPPHLLHPPPWPFPGSTSSTLPPTRCLRPPWDPARMTALPSLPTGTHPNPNCASPDICFHRRLKSSTTGALTGTRDPVRPHAEQPPASARGCFFGEWGGGGPSGSLGFRKQYPIQEKWMPRGQRMKMSPGERGLLQGVVSPPPSQSHRALGFEHMPIPLKAGSHSNSRPWGPLQL